MSVSLIRHLLPSEKERARVRRVAYETARQIVNIYCLCIAPLRIVTEESIEQMTSHKGRRYVSSRQLIVPFKIMIPEDDWKRRHKRLAELIEANIFPIHEYVSLALIHYQIARHTEPRSSFLNLIICIEALYNSPKRIRVTISNRVANLLGRTKETRRKIREDMLRLYKKRNTLVHGLKECEISSEDTSLLLSYSRCSLEAFMKIRERKKTVLESIDDPKRIENLQSDIENVLNRFDKGEYRFHRLPVEAHDKK